MLSEYLYQIRNTVILLGLDVRFADLLTNPDAIDEVDVEELQKVNGKLIEATKDKLAHLNRLTVVARG
jgi:hypothetical protein